MSYMATLPDKAFDLAIVDPPYGIGASKGGSGKGRIKHIDKKWDDSIPNKDYFYMLERVSINQIIFGANYFVEHLKPSMGWIFWNKDIPNFTMSDGELAYTSFNCKLREFKRCKGMDTGFNSDHIVFHPTRKPVKLYDWLLHNYAQPGQRILDTHLGSGSSAIAAHYYGVDFVGCELDEDYFNAAKKRFELATSQVSLFDV